MFAQHSLLSGWRRETCAAGMWLVGRTPGFVTAGIALLCATFMLIVIDSGDRWIMRWEMEGWMGLRLWRRNVWPGAEEKVTCRRHATQPWKMKLIEEPHRHSTTNATYQVD